MSMAIMALLFMGGSDGAVDDRGAYGGSDSPAVASEGVGGLREYDSARPTGTPEAAEPVAVTPEPKVDASPAVAPGVGTEPARALGSAETCEPFAASLCATVNAIAECESNNGRNPAAYDLNALNGGRLQINKSVWANYFLVNYGWSWDQIVLDDAINQQAAYIIWRLAGGSFTPWSCYR